MYTKADIKNYVAKSKFLSVIVDGSTDCVITDNKMVYLQSSQSSMVKTIFIRCCQVEWGTAYGIVKAMKLL